MNAIGTSCISAYMLVYTGDLSYLGNTCHHMHALCKSFHGVKLMLQHSLLIHKISPFIESTINASCKYQLTC